MKCIIFKKDEVDWLKIDIDGLSIELKNTIHEKANVFFFYWLLSVARFILYLIKYHFAFILISN